MSLPLRAALLTLALGAASAVALDDAPPPPRIEAFEDAEEARTKGCTTEELDGRRRRSCVLAEPWRGFELLRIFDEGAGGRFEYADWVLVAKGSWELADLMGTRRKVLVGIVDVLPVAQGEQKKLMVGVVLSETGPKAIFSEPLHFARSASLGCGAELRGDVRVEARAAASVLHLRYRYHDCMGTSLEWDESLPWDRATTSFYAADAQERLAATADNNVRRRLARCRLRVPFADAHDLCGTFPGATGFGELFTRPG